MKYAKLASIFSELFDTHYIVGRTEDGQFVYVWTNCTDYAEADEIPAALLDEPTDRNGALVGSADYIIDDIENCVGSFRDWGTDAQVAEASRIVDTLVGAIQEMQQA